MSADPYEMPCKDFVELATQYFENKLSSFDRERFEKHLEICEGCVTYLDQIRQTVQTLGKLTEESIPPEAREKLLEAFRNWKSG